MSSSSVFDIVAGRQDLQQVPAGDLLLGSADPSHEGLVDRRRSLSPRPVISPQASAVVTAFVARDRFCAEGSSISPLQMAASDGRGNVTWSSWHRGTTRSRHSFIAGERRLDGPARQPECFAIEHSRSGERRLVLGAPPTCGIA
jgi:hypothetical protein